MKKPINTVMTIESGTIILLIKINLQSLLLAESTATKCLHDMVIYV